MTPSMPRVISFGTFLVQCLQLIPVDSVPIIEKCLVHHTTVKNVLVCLQCDSNHIPSSTDGTRCEPIRDATDLVSCLPLDTPLNCNSDRPFCGPRSIYEGGLDFSSELISVCPIESCCSHNLNQYPFMINFHACDGHCTSTALDEFKKRRGFQSASKRDANFGEYYKTSVDDISMEATKTLAYMDDKLSVEKISAVDFTGAEAVKADAYRRKDKMLQVSSTSDLDSVMELKRDMRGFYNAFSGEASTKVSRDIRISSSSKTYYRYISQQSGLHSFPLADLKILPDAVNLLLTPGGIDEFIQLHGRYFVVGYFTACEVEMSQSVTCQTSRGISGIETDAKAKYGTKGFFTNPFMNSEARTKFDMAIAESTEICTKSEDIYASNNV